MEDKFETALFAWGAKVLIDVRTIIESMEMYEDCQRINDLLKKYNIDNNFDIEDWQASIWRFGFEGSVARNRIGVYLNKAMQFLYGDIKFKNPYHIVGRIYYNPITGESSMD